MSEGSSSPISGKNVANVSNIEYTKDASSAQVDVTTSSQTLEELLGEALPADVLAVTVVPKANVIYYNPAAAATTGNSQLPPAYTLNGVKAVLDLAEFIAGSTLSMGIIVHTPAYTAGVRD